MDIAEPTAPHSQTPIPMANVIPEASENFFSNAMHAISKGVKKHSNEKGTVKIGAGITIAELLKLLNHKKMMLDKNIKIQSLDQSLIGALINGSPLIHLVYAFHLVGGNSDRATEKGSLKFYSLIKADLRGLVIDCMIQCQAKQPIIKMTNNGRQLEELGKQFEGSLDEAVSNQNCVISYVPLYRPLESIEGQWEKFSIQNYQLKKQAVDHGKIPKNKVSNH